MCWDFEFDIFVTGGGHPHGESTPDNESSRCEIEYVSKHCFEAVRSFRSDVAGFSVPSVRSSWKLYYAKTSIQMSRNAVYKNLILPPISKTQHS